MPEPISVTSKAIADVILSLWEKSAAFLWCLVAACSAVVLLIAIAAYFGVGDGVNAAKTYGIELAAADVFFLVCAVFRSAIDFRSRKCLHLHFADDKIDHSGWSIVSVSERGLRDTDGRAKVPHLTQTMLISNSSKSDVEISSIKIVPRNFTGKTFAKSFSGGANGFQKHDQTIIPAMKTAGFEVRFFVAMDPPDHSESLAFDLILFDQFRRKHRFRRIVVRPSYHIEGAGGYSP